MMNRLIFVIIIVVGVSCDAKVHLENSTAKIVTLKPTGKSEKINICDFCECKDDTINCTGRQLTHNFDNASWPRTSLRIVSFADNSITHLKQFPNVTINKLILRYNKIIKIENKVFEQITNLIELDLSHNYLTSDILRPPVFEGKFNPNNWEPLPKLRVLNLGYNNLHTLNSDVFAHVPDVEVLSLSGNPFDIIDHSSIIALSNLYHLEELSLEYCNLETLPDNLFHAHKAYLRKLYLSGNRLKIIPNSLMEATKLEYLDLNENTFETFDHANAFPKLPELRNLNLRGLPHLRWISSGTFSHLEALEELNMSECPQLETIEQDAFALHDIHVTTWPPLKRLDLSNNKLKYLPQYLIANWSELERLTLTGNEWSCDCENQYLVGTLLPKLGATIMKNDITKMFCSSPPEHAGKNISSLKNRKLRCLDLYEARPERDAAILVGILVAVLLVIPVLQLVNLLRRHGFLFCYSHKNPAAYSRAFYQRASNDDYI